MMLDYGRRALDSTIGGQEAEGNCGRNRHRLAPPPRVMWRRQAQSSKDSETRSQVRRCRLDLEE